MKSCKHRETVRNPILLQRSSWKLIVGGASISLSICEQMNAYKQGGTTFQLKIQYHDYIWRHVFVKHWEEMKSCKQGEATFWLTFHLP